jgi:hypothetical protein
MKIVDKIDAENKIEALTDSERDDFFTQMLTGKDVTGEVDTSRGRFTMKYPKTKDMLTIGKLSAYRRDYKPASAFDAETEMFNVMASTLDVMIVSGPPWFERARKTGKNFSFLEAPSHKFLSELYGKAYSFRGEVDERLDTEIRPAAEQVSAPEGVSAPADGGGVFAGLSSEPDNPKP